MNNLRCLPKSAFAPFLWNIRCKCSCSNHQKWCVSYGFSIIFVVTHVSVTLPSVAVRLLEFDPFRHPKVLQIDLQIGAKNRSKFCRFWNLFWLPFGSCWGPKSGPKSISKMSSMHLGCWENPGGPIWPSWNLLWPLWNSFVAFWATTWSHFGSTWG